MMTTTVILTGIHNAGKSSVIKNFMKRDGVRMYPELGGEIRARSGCTSWTNCSIFDELVMLRELERDNLILSDIQQYRNIVLEQWHLGNIAHARIRTPIVADEYEERLEKHLKLWPTPVGVLHIHLDLEEMIKREGKRLSAEDAERMVRFYSRLEDETKSLIEKFSLKCLVLNSNQPREHMLSKADLLLGELS